MEMKELIELINNLPFDNMKNIYSSNNQTLSIYRPSKLSKRFKKYDKNKNFQIFLQDGTDKNFRPNHLRLLIDLKLRVRDVPEAKQTLLEVFDRIFYGQDPSELLEMLSNYHFASFINPIEITLYLAQLFIAEQNIGYGGVSKYNPPSLYLQGWIRTFIDSENEIDQIVLRICNNNPPLVKYTCCDDKNHKKYNPHSRPLWYIQ